VSMDTVDELEESLSDFHSGLNYIAEMYGLTPQMRCL